MEIASFKHVGTLSIYDKYLITFLHMKQKMINIGFRPDQRDYIKTVFYTSRKHLRTKVTPDFHLTYSRNGENLGSGSN